MSRIRLVTTTIASCLIIGACSKKVPDPVETIPAEHVERALTRLVTKWDYNDDGRATCEDVDVLRRQQFVKLDTNRDNRLSNREYRAANFEDKSFVFHDFTKLDANESGIIEPTEFIAVSHSEFRGLDKDDNCVIEYRDAAYHIVAERAQGLGGKNRGNKNDRRRKREKGKVDPFDG